MIESVSLIDLFKFSFLLLYILLVLFLVAAITFSSNTRVFLTKIHSSPSDTNSWLRYSCSFILIIALGIAIYDSVYNDEVSNIVALLTAISISGKVTASAINKDK